MLASRWEGEELWPMCAQREGLRSRHWARKVRLQSVGNQAAWRPTPRDHVLAEELLTRACGAELVQLCRLGEGPQGGKVGSWPKL
eukprot:2457812-Rhodomonas_salina.1